MNSVITRTLTQLENMQYPNPSQGYGIFSFEILKWILGTRDN